MSNYAIIPARGGSKTIKKKNLKDFCGKPLLKWTLDACNESAYLDEFWVSTEDSDIKALAVEEGAEFYRRDEWGCLDGASTDAVVGGWVSHLELKPKDNILILQCTSPYTRGIDIDACIHMLNTYDSVLSCKREKRFYWNDDGTPIIHIPKQRPMKQWWPGTWMENGAIYGTKVGFFQASGCRVSGKIGIYEMDLGFELDDHQDWAVGETIMVGTK